MGISIPHIYQVILLLGIVLSVTAYSKYGRTCKDIGCLPNEVCTLAFDTCSYVQREGKDCGSYPTCKRNTDAGGQHAGASLNPAPENTRFNQPAFPNTNREYNNPQYNNNPVPPVDPNHIFGQPVQNQQHNWNQYPIFPMPTQRSAQQPVYPQIPQPYPPPQNPYGQPPPYQPQMPFAFGNPPPGRIYPQYYTTTKEPSLLNQFLYNKQRDKKNSSSHVTPCIFLIAMSSLLYQFHPRLMDL